MPTSNQSPLLSHSNRLFRAKIRKVINQLFKESLLRISMISSLHPFADTKRRWCSSSTTKQLVPVPTSCRHQHHQAAVPAPPSSTTCRPALASTGSTCTFIPKQLTSTDQLQLHQAANTYITKPQTSSSLKSTNDNSARTRISTSRPHRPPTVN